MKKRIISVLLMSAMVLGMAGCNGSTETPQTTTEDSETTAATTTSTTNEDVATETTTVADTEEATKETTEAVETEATTTTTATTVEEPEIPEELPTISKIRVYDNNHIYFYDADSVSYAYNLEDNVMCKNGYGIIDRNLHVAEQRGFDIGYKFPLYNLITNEYYEYNCLGNYDGYYFVWKEESDFDGSAYYFGILDSNGEWVLPLSSDYEICNFDFNGLRNRSNYNVAFRTDSSFCFYANDGGSDGLEIITYNWKNDTLSYGTDNPALKALACGNGHNTIYTDPVLYDDSILFVYQDYYMYNINTGEYTILFDDGSLSYCGDGVYFIRYSDEQYTIIGKDFNKLYDITGYTINTDNGGNLCIDATENYAAFEADGADGKSYTIIIDKDGNRVVDPIPESLIAMSGDYVITESEVINCKTGERKAQSFKKVYDEYGRIVNIVDKDGRVMVYSDDGYYFIDPSNPDTLINPFELVDKIYTLE